MTDEAPRSSRRKRGKPLDSERLEALALHYLGRFATSRAKLERYLARKVAERGWEGEGAPDIAGIVARAVRAGYVDDRAYAAMRARDLSARGYGAGRLKQRLYADGISEDDRGAALDHAGEERVASALAFARRRRLGPYASEPIEDEAQRQRALAAFARAGHDFALSRAILALEPGADVAPDNLSEA